MEYVVSYTLDLTEYKVSYTIYYMKFNRKQAIAAYIYPKRALIIYGPRRIGKTTMLQSYLADPATKAQYAQIFSSTGDDFTVREIFRSEMLKSITDFARPYDLIAIDEAQNMPSIGLATKMIVDAFPKKNVILTGSSSLGISAKVTSPLTGRHFTLTLLPLSQGEMIAGNFELKNALSDFLIYGSYPEVLLEPDRTKKAILLTELISSYLFKDVLALDIVKSPSTLLNVVKCLAFQVGNEVSLHEIANTVQTDAKTVGRYIDILEKIFVIKKVRGFSRNLRNEISKKAKYYFLDNGVRNAAIAQFNDLTLRNDIGALWENFVFMELLKKSNLAQDFSSYYFWRTHTGQEIDIIKETNGALTAIECKWSEKSSRIPKLWKEAYPDAKLITITRENYLEYLLD